MMYNLKEVESSVNQFDKMKFIDTDGKEKISGRELAKALGYEKWQNFKNGIERANDQIKASGGADSELVTEVSKELKVKNQYGAESTRIISDYHLTRKQAINVANNCDTRKPQVALVQEYLYDTSEMGERVNNIYNKIKDRTYIENRSQLSTSNKSLSKACIEHGVDSKDLSKVHNACDEALYHMSTKEIKDQYGKTNRPKADFIGADMCAFENAAKTASTMAIYNKHPEGLEECSDISSKVHANMRDYIINNTYMKPENLITGEDVKKVETRYKKLTKEQLAAIEEEF